MIAGHNLSDGIQADSFGSASWIWNLLHQPKLLEISPPVRLLVVYPLLPWPVGYVLGSLFKQNSDERRRFLLGAGMILILGFIALRASNLYGDPTPWAHRTTS